MVATNSIDWTDKSTWWPNDMSFGDALEAMKLGARTARRSWPRKDLHGIWVGADVLDGKPRLTFGYADSPHIKCSGWTATWDDMFAKDWYVVKDAGEGEPMWTITKKGKS